MALAIPFLIKSGATIRNACDNQVLRDNSNYGADRVKTTGRL